MHGGGGSSPADGRRGEGEGAEEAWRGGGDLLRFSRMQDYTSRCMK